MVTVVHLVHWKKSGIYKVAEAIAKQGVKYGDYHNVMLIIEVYD